MRPLTLITSSEICGLLKQIKGLLASDSRGRLRKTFLTMAQLLHCHGWLCGSWWQALTSPVGSAAARSAKGGCCSSKTYTLLAPLGILLEYWSYAFNNGLMSQGDLAWVLPLCSEFSISDISSRAGRWCCWVRRQNSHCCYSITLFSLRGVKV